MMSTGGEFIRWSRTFLFAFFQEFEVALPSHFSCSHIGMNYVLVNFSISGNNNGPQNPLFDVTLVIALLSFENKTIFLENAFKDFPVNWRYTWHSRRSD